MADRAERPDVVVPEETAGRGTFLRGELCKDQLCCPVVLAQFEQIAPQTRKSRKVARLFSAIQGALYFATQWPLNPKLRPHIGGLHRDFLAAHPDIFDWLWPLLGSRTDASLYYLRNTIVQGEAYSEVDWTALGYEGEHLRWHLERIVLAALGWEIERSTLWARALSLFTAYQRWKSECDRLAAGMATL